MSKPSDARAPWIELKAGVPFCSPEELNRIARQQGLCLAIAQASLFDQICQAVALDPELEQALIHAYLTSQDVNNDAALERFLKRKGWDQADLRYFATKGERLERFKQQVFRDEVELRFLQRKLDLDQVQYSLIRVRDEQLAFELHQRLLEGEASFAELAATYSEGPESQSAGKVGPISLTQAHPDVVHRLRTSQPGQLLPPFFLVDIWLILRLDSWEGARLEDELREELLSELFHDWLQEQALHLLSGAEPAPLPVRLLSERP